MQPSKRFILCLLVLCIGLLGIGVISAQSTDIVLSESYAAPQDRVIFLYPTGWTVDKQNTFVAVTDTSTTIEFYTASASSRTIKLAGGDLEQSLLLFLDILGIEAEPNQAAQIELVEGESVIGTSVLAGGRLQYVLLVKGLLMDDPGQVFVRVEGNALDLIDSPDTVLAIIKTFGTLIATDGTTPTNPTNTTTTTTTTIQPTIIPTVVPTSAPCLVRATTANTATLRVGPGTNRSILLYLDPADEFVVQGTANDSTGARWWRLDKTKAAPAKASVVNETWVSDVQMTESGDCENIGTVAPPPIIRVRPTSAPLSTPIPSQPTPISGSTEPFVSFFASPNFIAVGDCTTLFWDTRNVKELYLIDDFGIETGVTGPSGSETVCPTPSLGFNYVVYTLRTVVQSGSDQFNDVEVTIDNAPVCLVPYPSFTDSGTVNGSSTGDTYDVFIDPSICGFPVTVYIDVFATNSDMDPYMDVYMDGVYFSNDDDSGSGLDSFMLLTISTPTLLRIDVSNLISANGTYTISVYIE